MKRVISIVAVIVLVLSIVVFGSYRWHSSAMTAQASAFESRLAEAIRIKDAQQCQIGRLVKSLQDEGKGYDYNSYKCNIVIRPLDGSGKYYEARDGSEDIILKFSQNQ